MTDVPSSVFDTTEAAFDADVIAASHGRPVVVDFWAPWCGPCRMLGPVLERLVEERDGDVALAKVNIDEEPGLAERFGVSGIPAVKAFRDGTEVLEFVGLLPESHLRDFLDQLVPSEADRLVAEARGLEAERPAEAETLYRRVIESDVGNDAARVGLARVLLAAGRPDEVEAVLAPVVPAGATGTEAKRLRSVLAVAALGRDFGTEAAARARLAESPGDARRRYELGCVLAAAGKTREGLEELLAAAEADAALARTAVKEAMVTAFHAVGVRSELADEFREKLARVLY